MSEYREIAPSAAFAATVEGFWSLDFDGPAGPHRVTPDGCADILWSEGTLSAVGPMTRYQDFLHAPGERLMGVRFRPGAWTSFFKIPGDRITDIVLPLEDLWGPRARHLQNRLSSGASLEDCARLLESS